MHRGQDLRRALGLEGIDVCEYRARYEPRRQPALSGRSRSALPDEEGREEREDEEADIPRVESFVAVQREPEELRDLEGDRCQHRQPECDKGFAPGRPACLARIVGAHDELLPEPFRVLARELPRQRVEVAEALDRDQEGLVFAEIRSEERRDLLAQMVLQLLDVDWVDRLAVAQEAPPLSDLLLEPLLAVQRFHASASLHQRHGQRAAAGVNVSARKSWVAWKGSASADQIPRSVSSTACHCSRSSASWVRPRFVIR